MQIDKYMSDYTEMVVAQARDKKVAAPIYKSMALVTTLFNA